MQALYFGDAIYLKNWMKICPKHQFTTLDTHDGIGVMDTYHLLPDDEIDRHWRGCMRSALSQRASAPNPLILILMHIR